MLAAHIVAVHIVGLALAVASVARAGDRPQVLVYAFILEYALRLATVFAVAGALRRPQSALARLAALVYRTPFPSDASQPLRYEHSAHQPVGPGGYFFTILFLAFLAFVLTNVSADRELELDRATFEQDLAWAAWLTAIYWVQSLLARTTVIDPEAPWPVNVGYNIREITILAMAVLIGGLIVVARQAADLPASGWTVLGPLFALRFVYDLWSALQLTRPRVSGSANPSRRRESRPPARLS